MNFIRSCIPQKKTDENMAQKFKQSIATKLSGEQKDELNKNITPLAIKSSLKLMNNNKVQVQMAFLLNFIKNSGI